MTASTDRQNASLLRVGFDCPGAAPLFLPHLRTGIGGAEVRAVTFAQQLAHDDRFAIHFVVAEHPDEDAKFLAPTASKIQIHAEKISESPAVWFKTLAKFRASLEQRCRGLPTRRPFFERLKVDVLCTFGLTNRTAGVIRSARRKGTRSIVFLTSDRNLDDLSRRGRRNRGLYGELGFMCRYAVEHADRVVVQTEHQADRLERITGDAPVLIRNPIDLDERIAEGQKTFDVLWVGRADKCSKRADLAMKLARHCPQHQFTMIMNRHDDRLFDELMKECPSNVRVIEQVPFREVENYYAQSRVLLNTSVAEGFPNSFLQAAKYGLPIVSLQVDPDRMIERFELGYVGVGALAPTAIALRRILDDVELRRQISRRVRVYVKSNHSLTDRAHELGRLVMELAERHQTPRYKPDETTRQDRTSKDQIRKAA